MIVLPNIFPESLESVVIQETLGRTAKVTHPQCGARHWHAPVTSSSTIAKGEPSTQMETKLYLRSLVLVEA